MNRTQMIVTVAAVSLGVMLPRLLPFIVLGGMGGARARRYIDYLGRVLPSASISLIVVYCFKDAGFMSGNHGVPELIGTAVTAVLHGLRGNILISIGAGAAVYLVLVNFIFI